MKRYRKLISECERLDDQGFYGQSIDRLTEALEDDSSVDQLFFQRGSRYVELGELSLALSDYSEAIRIDPAVVDYLVCRGNVYGDLARHFDAINDYEAAIEINPALPSPHQFLSLTYSWLGQSEKAIKHADRAIELDEKDALSYYCSAYSRMGEEDYPYAVEKLLIAIKLEEDCANYWSTLGRCYLKINKMEESRRCYERAIEIAPKAAFYIKLAKIKIYKEDPEGAIEQLMIAREFELNDQENMLVKEYTRCARELKGTD